MSETPTSDTEAESRTVECDGCGSQLEDPPTLPIRCECGGRFRPVDPHEDNPVERDPGAYSATIDSPGTRRKSAEQKRKEDHVW